MLDICLNLSTGTGTRLPTPTRWKAELLLDSLEFHRRSLIQALTGLVLYSFTVSNPTTYKLLLV